MRKEFSRLPLNTISNHESDIAVGARELSYINPAILQGLLSNFLIGRADFKASSRSRTPCGVTGIGRQQSCRQEGTAHGGQTVRERSSVLAPESVAADAALETVVSDRNAQCLPMSR